MSVSSNKKGFWKRLAESIGNWPISREIGSFVGDVSRHYKLDVAASSALSSAHDLKGDYKQSSSSLRFWLFTALAVTFIMIVITVVYHAINNPNVSRTLHLPMPADCTHARMIDLVDISGGGGQVQPCATVTLTSRINAMVTKVPVNLGDIVDTNTTLYECDPRAVKAALEAAKQTAATDESAVKLAEMQDQGNQDLKKQGLASDADLLATGSALATARSNAALAQVGLVNAEYDLANATVKSPVNGIVLQRLINPSERVIPNEMAFQLGDLQSVYFLAQIAEDKISSVQTGLQAEVIFPAFPGETFTGTVFFVDPKTDPNTRAFTAYIKIANPGLRLKPGLSGFGKITSKKHVLAVPDSALINPVGENATVFVITSDSRAVLRPVRFGVMNQGYTEIVDGLKEGEIVAVVGSLYLVDGDKVHYTINDN